MMKFFTAEWWGNGCEDETVEERYRAYLSSVASRLPVQLLEFDRVQTLHDAEIVSTEHDPVAKSLKLELEGSGAQECLTQFALTFSGVTEFQKSAAHPEHPAGIEETVGYCEYEALAGAATQMRILMDSGSEISITFQGVSIEHAPKVQVEEPSRPSRRPRH